jgi:hypothetical protein
MEAKMAHVVHHHHIETFELPPGVHWAGGVVLALLAFILIYFSMTNTTDVASVSPALIESPTAPLWW